MIPIEFRTKHGTMTVHAYSFKKGQGSLELGVPFESADGYGTVNEFRTIHLGIFHDVMWINDMQMNRSLLNMPKLDDIRIEPYPPFPRYMARMRFIQTGRKT